MFEERSTWPAAFPRRASHSIVLLNALCSAPALFGAEEGCALGWGGGAIGARGCRSTSGQNDRQLPFRRWPLLFRRTGFAGRDRVQGPRRSSWRTEWCLPVCPACKRREPRSAWQLRRSQPSLSWSGRLLPLWRESWTEVAVQSRRCSRQLAWAAWRRSSVERVRKEPVCDDQEAVRVHGVTVGVVTQPDPELTTGDVIRPQLEPAHAAVAPLGQSLPRGRGHQD